MLQSSSRAANAVRSVQRLAAGYATATSRIGDTKVPMSLLEKGAYINYQRIEDNLSVVRQRYCSSPLVLLKLELTIR
jgi:aconitate hydratase